MRNRTAILIGLAVAAVLLLIPACQPTDTTKPTVQIAFPHGGDTLLPADITIKVYAYDSGSVKKVVVAIDGTQLGELTSGAADTYSFAWSTLAETIGVKTHSIAATATDNAGNENSHTITVYISKAGGHGGGPTHHSDDITADETWYPSGNPHIVDNNINVKSGAMLTILPGCVVELATDAALRCGFNSDPGGIKAVGNVDSAILFTSTVSTPQKGDWDYVGLAERAMSATQFSYCTFEYGGGGAPNYGEVYIVGNTVAKIDHCTIRLSKDYGVVCDNAASGFASFTNNVDTGNTKYPIHIYPPDVGTIGAGNVLTGNTLNGVELDDGTGAGAVVASADWRNLGVPYVLTGSVDVGDASGPTLTIGAGTVLKLQHDVSFRVGRNSTPGTVVAVGKADSMIVFTSSLSAPQAGDWDYVGIFDAAQPTTQFSYCRFEYGGGGTPGYGAFYIDNSSPAAIDHCTISHSKDYGLCCNTTTAAFRSFTNNTLTANTRYPIHIYPDNIGKIGAGNVITGNTQEGVEVDGGTGDAAVKTTATWQNLGVAYILTGSVDVGDATGQPVLTIAPGTVIKLQTDLEFRVGHYNTPGGLIADGSGGQIVFTGAVSSAGSWQDIGFYQGSIASSCKLIHCKIEYGGSGSNLSNIYTYEANPTITNDSIGNSSTYGIYLDDTPHPDSLTLENNNTFYGCPRGHIGHS